MTLRRAGVDAGEAAGRAAGVRCVAVGPAVCTLCTAEAVDAAEATDARQLGSRVGTVGVR